MRKVDTGFQPRPYDPEWTIRKGLETASGMNPNAGAGITFIADDGTARKLSFDEVRDEALRRARWLMSLGLEKGDTCAFVIPEPDEFVLTFLGAAAVGIIPVPLYPPMGFGKLDAYIRDTAKTLNTAKVKILLTSKRVQPVLWSLVDKVDTMRELVTVERFVGEPKNAPTEYPTVVPEDTCFLQFTSGSTAAPKGVVVTHKSLGVNGHAIMQYGLEVDVANDKCCAWLPLYHDMGLIGFVISPLTCGLESLFMPTMSFIKRPSSWMQAVHDHKGTITFAPNFAYGLAARRTRPEQVAKLDLSRLRIMGAGAEPNHPATLNEFTKHFAPAGLREEAILPCYGMAEATLAMTFCQLDVPFRVDTIEAEVYAETGRAVPMNGDTSKTALEFVSCGLVWPNHEMDIIDNDGTVLGERQVGEVVFRGGSITPGYFENPTATAESFREDGLRTGDLGYVADGELFVTGRKKDLIILNGRNYDPQSIEWAVAEVEGIRKGNVMAFSRPGEHTEELVVVAETKQKADLEALIAEVRRVVRHELSVNPADVVLTGPGTLPKTTSGKLQRSKARQQYLEGSLGVEGVRTMGEKGQTLTLAKHVAKSTVSRVRHAVKKRTNGIFNRFPGQGK